MHIKRVVAKLLKKYEDGSVSVLDDFLSGHCHEFAIALHKIFGYKLGLIKSSYTTKDTKEKKYVLLHAFALDNSGKAYDVEGKYNVSEAIEGYKNTKNPTYGDYLKNISHNTYSDEKSFRKKLWSIKVDKSHIEKAIKKVTKNPLLYFDARNIKKIPPLKFNKTLVTNEKWSWNNEEFYKHRQNIRFDEKIKIALKKNFKSLDNKWIVTDAHLVWKGLYINLGLGTYDFDLLDHKVIEADTKIDKKLSDEDSKKNVNLFLKELSKYALSSDVREWFKKTLKIKEGSMQREDVIKKAMMKLRVGSIESIKKELQDYIKTDAKEVFQDIDDVEISGKVEWDDQDEDYKLHYMEITSASIHGFAEYLLHDLYEGKIPSKEQITEDAKILHKEFVGKTFPFKAYDKDAEVDLSGEIKVLATKYDSKKDEIIITKSKLEDIQVD